MKGKKKEKEIKQSYKEAKEFNSFLQYAMKKKGAKNVKK